MHDDDIVKMTFGTHHDRFELLVMLFGLTNAPTTFQAMMNDVLHDSIRHFVLVFFDDILIYNTSWSSHLQHVHTVLHRLHEHKLPIKRNKCASGTNSMAYLGHVISAQGVAMDAEKVVAVWAWPSLCTVHALCGFLSLMVYYRKFTCSYGDIAAPLT
jgi:hypothetical protein